MSNNIAELLQNWGNAEGNQSSQWMQDVDIPDTAETVYVSPLALLKMLKHGQAGIPMEVMGLMLGETVDEYTVTVVDVFSMPQSGNSVSVEAVDPVYQADMLEYLKRTNRTELVVGWYHSHPGFGCWFSSIDIQTQQSFEQLSTRAVGIVVDPVQSVKGKVVIDCFRLIGAQVLMIGQEPRQITSVVGHVQKPSLTALVHGLNRNYYSLVIAIKMDQDEANLLRSMKKVKWTEEIISKEFRRSINIKDDEEMNGLCESTQKYVDQLNEELEIDTYESWIVKNAGKVNSSQRILQLSEQSGAHRLRSSYFTLVQSLIF